jgi:hypothetical protein
MHSFLQHIVHRNNKVVTNKIMSRLSGEVFSILLAFIVATSISFAQTYRDWTLNGNVTNNGTINVRRNIINATTGLVSVTGTGVVKLIGTTAGSHAIRCTNIADTYPVSIIRLDLTGIRVTTLNTPTLVPTRLRIGDGTTAYTAASPGFTIGSQTLTIGDVSTYIASTAVLTFSGGTVDYTNATSQTLLDHKAIYGTLKLSGNGNYTIPSMGDGSFEAATVNHTGTGSVTLNDSLKVTGSAAFGTIADVASGKMLQLTSTTAPSTINTLTTLNGTIQKAGTQKLVITTVTTTIASGVIENTGTDSLAIRTLSGNVGTIRNTSTGFLSFNTPATNTGTISNTSTSSLTFYNTIANNGVAGVISNTSTGTVTFVNNLTGTGTVSQTTADGIINVGGSSFTQSTYTLTPFGTVVYNGTAAQSVTGGGVITYHNLTIATTVGNATASAALTLTGNLVINSGSTLDMAGFTTSSFPGGSNNNLGTIKWSGNNVYVSGAGTTEFYSAAVGNVATGANYGILLFSGTGMKTFATAGTTTATGNMTVNSGAQVTVNNGVTVQVNGSTLLSGNVTNNGAVNVGP